jgi:hypothetical protein
LTGRTELEHRVQRGFEDHLVLHATTADRRKPGSPSVNAMRPSPMRRNVVACASVAPGTSIARIAAGSFAAASSSSA